MQIVAIETKAGPAEDHERPEALMVPADLSADLERCANAASPKMTAGQFSETYKEWIAEQNARVEKCGLWNEEFRLW